MQIVTVKSPVENWQRIVKSGPRYEYEYKVWIPTLECGHPHYGDYHANSKEGLPLALDCYRCQDIASAALKAG